MLSYPGRFPAVGALGQEDAQPRRHDRPPERNRAKHGEPDDAADDGVLSDQGPRVAGHEANADAGDVDDQHQDGERVELALADQSAARADARADAADDQRQPQAQAEPIAQQVVAAERYAEIY